MFWLSRSRLSGTAGVARVLGASRPDLLGYSTAQIGDRLFLSPYTVQDHLKAVFDKTGVRSRRELAADLFRHYLPRIERGSSLTADGWFEAG